MASDPSTTWPQPYGYCEYLRPTSGIEEINPFDIVRAVKDIYTGIQITRKCYKNLESNSSIGYDFYSSERWLADIAYFYNGDSFEVVLLFFASALWGLFSYWLLNFILKPVPGYLGIRPQNCEKFKESALKFISNTIMWLMLAYLVFFRGHSLITESFHIFNGWKLRNHPTDLKLGYLIEASYYIHALYHTVFVEERRKDTGVMVIHHFVALALILGSYLLGHLKGGILIFFLDDTSDVLLEFGKVTSYLIDTKSGYSLAADITSQTAGGLFAISWFVLRIIFHVTLVWRLAAFGTIAYFPVLPFPFYYYFNILIASLYIFYCYWFWFISAFLVSLVLRKKSMMKDSRDIEDKKET